MKGAVMILVKPSHEILTPIDGNQILKNIERAGRTCYKTDQKITEDSSFKFVANIIKKGHHSVIEHENISVRFICDRGVTHELVRHRLAAYSQESTRYCNYSKDRFGNQVTFVIPPWISTKPGTYNASDLLEGPYFREFVSDSELQWLWAMIDAEAHYFYLIEQYWSAEQARSVLPNSLKTEIVMTANLREWRHVLELRTSKRAHPQIQEIMYPLLIELTQRIPVVFDDISRSNHE